jgi:hypothetical protein
MGCKQPRYRVNVIPAKEGILCPPVRIWKAGAFRYKYTSLETLTVSHKNNSKWVGMDLEIFSILGRISDQAPISPFPAPWFSGAGVLFYLQNINLPHD